MQLKNEFSLPRSLNEVWEFFHDIPTVASCLPGATYQGLDESGRHKGTMTVKVGPFKAGFEGLADARFDEAAKSIEMVGQGVDKKGGSRGKLTMVCRLSGDAALTVVEVESTLQLSGAVAQFGRPAIVEEVAKVMIADFVANAQAALGPAPLAAAGPADEGAPARATAAPAPGVAGRPAAAPPPRANSVSAGGLLWRSFLGWLKSLWRSQAR